MVEHRSIKRLVCNASYVEWKREDVMLQMASMAEDAATFEIWGALVNGVRLVVAQAGDLTEKEVGSVLRDGGVTVAWLSAGGFMGWWTSVRRDWRE
jgi:hypothetical protein